MAFKPTDTEREKPHAFSIDYRKQGDKDGLINRGFWIHNVPRIVLACRLRGHKPVVDGTEGTRAGRPGYRWVCCDRCGLRPCPQGDLDPTVWSIGDVYSGQMPGPWPRVLGTLGGQLLLGRRGGSGVGISATVGYAGDDHTLAGHVSLGRLGALYLHADGFGTRVQRRLNPVGYNSRVTDVAVQDGRLRWRLWAKRDEHSASTPRWRDGSVVVDLRERLWGPLLYSYEPVGEPVAAMVRMPEGDDHEVVLKLRRVRRGRKRGVGELSWSADWSSKNGIPFRNDSWKGNEVMAASVKVSDAAVKQDRWVAEACAGIAANVSAMRTRYQWRTPEGQMAENGAPR